jgi:RNA polymerase sigma factor (sigma-70 family)
MTLTDVPGDVPGSVDPTEQAVLAIHRQSRLLHGVAMSLLGDAAAAQDVVQDTIEAVLRLRPDLADDTAAVRYAWTAVVNRSRSVLRRQATAGRFLRRTREEIAPPADEPVLLADEHREVLAQFRHLPERQREVLTLRHFAQLPDDEIADALGISVSTVRSNASRGLATLSRLLAPRPTDARSADARSTEENPDV